jgi:polysaccharide pyruvyl transferase WcaK-like protein
MGKTQDKIRVLCFGYNGANNTGSEAKLLCTLRTIEKIIGARIAELAILTLNKENQKRYLVDHPDIHLIEIGPWALWKNLKLLFEKYDLLFLSEGSTFIDHFSSLFLFMFCVGVELEKLRGYRVVSYGNDCGHLKPLNQRILRHTVTKIDLLMLRNPDALARMREYGVTNEIHVTADATYEYPLPSLDYRKKLLGKLGLNPKERPIIGISPKEFFWWPIALRPWGPKEDLYRYPFYHTWPKGGKESSQRFVEQSARHADWCVETYHSDIALISMEHMDYLPTWRIHDAMKHKDLAIIIASDEYVVDDMISVLSVLKALITTRYHGVVLSSCSATPVIAVSSDARCEAVFRELEMMHLYIDYVEHPSPTPKIKDLDERLIEMTKTLMHQEGGLKKRIAEKHLIFVERAHQNEVLLKKWFEVNFPSAV